MIYPNFLNKDDTIGVCAPSDGIIKPGKVKRLDFAIQNFKNLDFDIKESASVRKSFRGVSNTKEVRAHELMELFLNKKIKAVICATGGDFLMEILPLLDLEIIKNNIKWIQGYSDSTGLLYVITTNLDIATIYGNNFAAFGMCPWHKSLENNFSILKGNIVKQNSFFKYESGYYDYINGDEGYVLDSDVYWQNLNNQKEIKMEGRIIGGCIDVLAELFGTRFDKTRKFIHKYKDDGIIWYFDNYEKTMEDLRRILWKFKDNRWFLYTKGIIFGRMPKIESYYGFSLEEVLSEVLGDLEVPIIMDVDIGHVAPRLTIINGAIATIISKNGKGSITFNLK